MMESQFKGLTPDEYQELFSNFLIDSWSYSKVTSFARNEKAFEMQYVYGLYSRSSATTIAGQAYHHALQYYFTQKKAGKTVDLPDLQLSAFAYLDEVPANRWKVMKTTPTVESAQIKATETATKLLKNFYEEKAVYEDEIAEILAVEVRYEEFVTVNGVDAPLPCHAVVDLLVITTRGTLAVVDHKSKSSYTPDNEVTLAIGVQAITYEVCHFAKTGVHIDEAWFIENKHSKNSDGSPQLRKFQVDIDTNTRKLYEALLYEPLKRLIEAVSNPDYTYLINDSDNMVDMAELYDFWARTMMCEVDEFNVEETKKALVAKRLKKIRDSSIDIIPPTVLKKFKENADRFIQYDLSDKNMTPEQKIEHVLRSFKIIARCAYTFEGFSSNTYLIEVSAGVKVSSIYSYKLDIANALNVSTVRFSKELVKYDKKSYLAVEFVKEREKDLIFNPEDLESYKIPIGKDNFNNTIVWDLSNHSTPHALVCGATGSGKSVCVASTIEYAIKANIGNIVILDPKYEFNKYIKRGAVVVNEISSIESTVEGLVDFMNKLIREGRDEKTLVIFDEFADAFANARPEKVLNAIGKKTLQENLRLLLQLGRSCGIRIMASTQRASAKIINGDAKVNFPVQICFRVPKATDSKVVLDEAGAEGLAGRGDGLMKSPQYDDIVRFQAYFKP